MLPKFNSEYTHPMKGPFTKLLRCAYLLFVVCLSACSTVGGGNDIVGITPGFVVTGSLTTTRVDHTATLLQSGKVLVSGGITPNKHLVCLASAELYDPATGSWSATGSLATARALHTATLLPNGKVLVAGGYDEGGLIDSAELYDPATGSWSATGSLAKARKSHTATLLSNGKVLVSGGTGWVGKDFVELASAELYDPVTGKWTTTGSLAVARESHTATLLSNGKVLVNGGTGSTEKELYVDLTSAELYDPTTGHWTATGSLAAARDHHTATLLFNGKVLVSGGYGKTTTRALERYLFSLPEYSKGTLSSSELYDPDAETWTVTGSLATARQAHAATLLSNGTVLVSGGSEGSGFTLYRYIFFHCAYCSASPAFASAELYDPNTGVWTATGSLTVPRSTHTATLLHNHKVLISGGVNEDGFTSNTELYELQP